MGEPAVTQLARVLLDVPALSEATLALVRERTGVDTAAVLRWRAESVQVDGGRTDLDAVDDMFRPIVIVEIKFGAELTVGQMVSYLRSQAQIMPGAAAALVALVPEPRVPEAERVLAQARAEVPEATTSVIAISWESWLSTWDRVPDLPPEVRGDLFQFRGLCIAMSGLVIPPFDSEPGADWTARRDDLVRLVDLVTRGMVPTGSRVSSQGGDQYAWYEGRRYFGPVLPTGSAASLGLVGGWAEEGAAALWLRFHTATTGFAEVVSRVRASTLDADARYFGGHVWLPIGLPVGLSDDLLVRTVEANVRDCLEALGLSL